MNKFTRVNVYESIRTHTLKVRKRPLNFFFTEEAVEKATTTLCRNKADSSSTFANCYSSYHMVSFTALQIYS